MVSLPAAAGEMKVVWPPITELLMWPSRVRHTRGNYGSYDCCHSLFSINLPAAGRVMLNLEFT